MKYVFLILFIVYLSPAFSQTFTEGFEAGTIHPDWKPSDNGSKTLSAIATSPTCNGLYSLKSTATYPPDFVTSLSLVGRNPFKELKIGQEYWIGTAVYLANGWPVDGNYGEVLIEAHHRPDKDLGEPSGGIAPLSLRTRKGQWLIHAMTSPKKLCTKKCSKNVLYENIGAYKPDTWTNFVFNVKFSHTNSGFLKVWKDNQLVVNYSGPIGYNDTKGPWLMMGVYKASWKIGKSKIKTRTVYHDEISIKQGKGSPTDVAPNCGKGSDQLPPPSSLKIIN